MTTNHKLRVLCEELLVKLTEYDSADPYHDCKDLIDRARNALADNSSPKLLGLDDLEKAWNQQADKYNSWDELGLEEIVIFAQQLALTCQLKPVARSQRLPSSDDVEYKLNFCWWYCQENNLWCYCDGSYCDPDTWTHWLPCYAIPNPHTTSKD
jgi:hypothetical protein